MSFIYTPLSIFGSLNSRWQSGIQYQRMYKCVSVNQSLMSDSMNVNSTNYVYMIDWARVFHWASLKILVDADYSIERHMKYWLGKAIPSTSHEILVEKGYSIEHHLKYWFGKAIHQVKYWLSETIPLNIQ